MKILITGALGHIGSRLIRELSNSRGHLEIVMVDNMLTQRYCSLFDLPSHNKYRFIEANILDTDLNALFKDVDVVIHLAAITDAANSFDNKEDVEEVNFVGTQRVAMACAQIGCGLFFPSTTSVYGKQEGVVDENCNDDELQPQSPYADSKLRAERYLQIQAKEMGLRFAICRLGTIFGTSVGMRFHTAINKFCWQAVMKKPITVWKTAYHQKRPYLDLGDAINAIQFVIENDLFNGEIYNVLTTNSTVKNITDLIQRYVPDQEIKFVDTEIMNQLSYDVLNQRFRDLGFEFRGDLDTGIRKTIELLKHANGLS